MRPGKPVIFGKLDEMPVLRMRRLVAVPFETQDRAMLAALANADGLIRCAGPTTQPAPKGTLIDVIVFDHLGSAFCSPWRTRSALIA
jgi:molybdopterin biosynthesis enzyme